METRISVFVGHFGSGKTEIALNYAFELSNLGRSITIADLDIVNPYFCTRDEEAALLAAGIRVVSTPKELSNAELGTIPLNALSIFDDKSREVVVDVGGDDQGAIALGQFKKYFEAEPYELYFVVNCMRPATATAEGIIEAIAQIESASRLRVTWLVNNTNISYETTARHIEAGQSILQEVSQKTGLPVAFTSVREDLVPEVECFVEGKILPLHIYMQPDWLRS